VNKLKSLFLSQFSFWVLALIVCSYMLFSFNTSVFRDPEYANLGFGAKILKSIKIPNINLGIDLQGGAHLVVSVDVDKAIDNRLSSEGKFLDQVLRREDAKSMPKKKEIRDKSLVLNFASEDYASDAYRLLKEEAKHLKIDRKGLDVLVSLPANEIQRMRSQSVEQAIGILGRRLDTAGVQGLVVQQHGEKQISIQLPGEESIEEKKELISKTAHLEFKMIEKQAASKDALLDEFDGDLPSDKEILSGREEGRSQYYLVSAFPDLTGDHIVFAKEDFDEYGRLLVSFRLDSVGTREFADLTANNVGKNLGIVIDNVVYSAPRIQGPIPRGECQITGSYTSEEARALSIVLNSGALQAPLKFEYETRVGSSLGADSINKGIISCLVGLLLVLLFSIMYYRLAGIFAMLALVVNLFLIMLFLSWFKFALTLPGIAGMVLTIGMAIDASILIYERIREELSSGGTMRKSVVDGFSGAMVVILDSNITTFLTGLVLFKFGSPAIRGFAVTLMAGIVATILAGIFFLKSLFLFFLDNTNIKRFGLGG